MTEPADSEVWPPPRSARADLARLVVVFIVLVGLAMLLMAATHATGGGCGGG